MADRAKRDWFSTGDSDDEEQDLESDLNEESRGKAFAGRDPKRRKLDRNEIDKEDADDDDDEDGNLGTSFETARESLGDADEYDDQQEMEATRASGYQALPQQFEVKPALSAKERTKAAKKLAKAQAKVSKTGVIYISRIPPFMKPHTLKHLLMPFAPSGLDRVFLTPEDPEAHKSRVKSGGNKKKMFSDGWVEFVSKREAKLAAEALNGKNIGGKKGSYYYDDVWNLKYLKGFKWRHLTEQIANENAEREAKLRAQTVRERKETREFLRNIERAKMLDGMEKKRKAKGVHDQQDMLQQSSDRKKKTDAMQFKQSEVVSKTKRGQDGQPSVDTQRVLSKIF